ncbi:MAG: TULIP family P47-like protein [Pseudomonadota bacterium]
MSDLKREGASDTAGGDWDVIYTTSFPVINAGIVAANSTPTEQFDPQIGNSPSDTSYRKITGTFGDVQATTRTGHWQLATGGSGRRVWMTLPDIRFTYEKHGQPDVQYTNCVLKISFNMEFRPTNRLAKGGGVIHELRIKTNADGENSFIDFEDYSSSPTPATADEITIKDLFSTWLEANMDKFDHVFAEVVKDDVSDVPKFQWMQPTALGYGVNDTEETAELATGFLAISTMTENRAAPKAIIVPDAVLPAGKTGSFLVSSERFMDKMLRPGIGNMFDDPTATPGGGNPNKVWPEGYFDIVGGNTLTNNEDLTINSFEYSETEAAVPATLEANNLTVVLSNKFLTFNMFQLKHSYGFLVDVTHDMRVFLEARLNDKKQFDLTPALDPELEEIAFHNPQGQKSDAAKTIDWILLFLDIAALFTIVGEISGWMRAEEGAVDVAEDEASASRTDRVKTDPKQPKPTRKGTKKIEMKGGEPATGAKKTSIGNILWGTIVSLKGAAVATMSAVLVAKQVYEAYREGEAEDTLPEFGEFAATVMDPIAWNNEGRNFNVTEARFEDGFLAIGEDA